MAPTTRHVIGNWKMNGSRDFVEQFFDSLHELMTSVSQSVEVAVCPPFPLIAPVAARTQGTRVHLGAQDMSTADGGAHTGDVSAALLLEWGVEKVILGHSERRAEHGETSETVAQKAIVALEAGLQPIICVGETAEDRAAGKAEDVVAGQLQPVLQQLGPAERSRCLVAYEPVWAIGTGDTATPAQAQAMHAFIRSLAGKEIPLLYGGSVKADNAAELFAQPDIDGGLIGGASLDANEFIAICQAAGQAR